MTANLSRLRGLYDSGIMQEFSAQGGVDPPSEMAVTVTVDDATVKSGVETAIQEVAREVNG